MNPGSNLDLFSEIISLKSLDHLCDGACVLRAFAVDDAKQIFHDIAAVLKQAPLRQVLTPGGQAMSVQMSNCGEFGWISDRLGYRYSAIDPTNGTLWPTMPPALALLAMQAAQAAGYSHFKPDACLINCYPIGAQMRLHQDRDEQDFTQPIVSVSLGLPATFLFGGDCRSDKTISVPLFHGDVVVWGGNARRRFHGVLPIKSASHPMTGMNRINLTFRRAK